MVQCLELGGVEGLQEGSALGFEREIEDLAQRLNGRSRHLGAALLEDCLLDLQDRRVLLGLERTDDGAVGRSAV